MLAIRYGFRLCKYAGSKLASLAAYLRDCRDARYASIAFDDVEYRVPKNEVRKLEKLCKRALQEDVEYGLVEDQDELENKHDR